MSNPVPRPPRIALIGVSGYARIYCDLVREWHDRGALQPAAAVIINPGDEAAVVADLSARGTRVYDSCEAMFAAEAGRIDLCLIPTGIAWHTRMSVAALRAGMQVLVEKPLAGSLADVAAIRAAERETGRWVAVGFQDLYADQARWLKDRIVQGAIGRLRAVGLVGLWPRPRSYYARNHWAGRLAADGAAVLDSPLNNAFAHFVNLGLFFAGSTPATSARPQVVAADLGRAHAIESFDTAIVRAHASAEQVDFWMGVSHACRETRPPAIHLVGTAGRAEWHHEGHCRLLPTNGSPESIALPDVQATRRAMFAAVLARLHRSDVRICDTATAEAHTALVEAVHAAGTIRPIPAERITWDRPIEGNGAVPCIIGLEETFDRGLRALSEPVSGKAPVEPALLP
jgi:predicted dehydrogenase